MGDRTIDYARPTTANEGAAGPFLLPAISDGVTPRLRVSGSRVTIEPTRSTRRDLLVAIAKAAACVVVLTLPRLHLVLWQAAMYAVGPARVPGCAWIAVVLSTIGVVAGATILARHLGRARRARAKPNWLSIDLAEGAVTLPSRDESLAVSELRRVECVERDRSQGEIRFIAERAGDRKLERVAIVRSTGGSLRPLAASLAARLSLPLDEYALHGRTHAVVHQTDVDGNRKRSIAPGASVTIQVKAASSHLQ